jgi:RHS repeat-associated protein
MTYHFDQLGSTVALTDENCAVTDRFDYGVYGEVTYHAGSTDTPFQYVGRLGVETDPNGLCFMRARYYSPVLRRFINADPIRFGGGLNWYGYCGGDPLGNVDPWGLVSNTENAQWYHELAQDYRDQMWRAAYGTTWFYQNAASIPYGFVGFFYGAGFTAGSAAGSIIFDLAGIYYESKGDGK